MGRRKKLRGVSLFSGAGGMDLGFKNAGISIIWANEIDPSAVATYRKNFENHITIGDIREISSSKIPDCDIIFGGPPCQGFSVAGKMCLQDPRSQLVWEFMRIVKEKKPKVFVMENVKNLAINDRFEDIRRGLVSAAEKVGYCTEIKILNSKHFGVPQARERTIFIGVQKKLKINVDSLFPKENLSYELTVRDVLTGIPSLGGKENFERCNAKIVPAKNPIMRKSPYAGMLFNGQGRPLDLDRPAITMTASMGGNKTPFIDEKFLKNETRENWIEEYHRYLQDGGKPYKEVPSFLRRITVFESAILQSFPKEYKFVGSQCSKYKQIGNAVPPKLAQEISKKIIKNIA